MSKNEWTFSEQVCVSGSSVLLVTVNICRLEYIEACNTPVKTKTITFSFFMNKSLKTE